MAQKAGMPTEFHMANDILNLLKTVSDPFMIATIYLLKNNVSPEKKYHKTKNRIGLGASIPISELR